MKRTTKELRAEVARVHAYLQEYEVTIHQRNHTYRVVGVAVEPGALIRMDLRAIWGGKSYEMIVTPDMELWQGLLADTTKATEEAPPDGSTFVTFVTF